MVANCSKGNCYGVKRDMEKDGESEESQKGGFPLATVALWAAVVIILYVLGSGPIVMLVEKRTLSPQAQTFVGTIYAPVSWACEETPLHRPIGIYLHLWDTSFNSSGDRR